MTFLMRTFIAALFLTAIHANANQNRDYAASEVLGTFANQGYIGAMANTLTISEAHRTCIGSVPSGFEASNNRYQNDYYNGYRECMRAYVPFRDSGAGGAGSCSSEVVSWGECSATMPASSDGYLFNARNTFNTSQFEGFASVQCSGGSWGFVGGGCSSAVQECEANQVVSWGATSPLWADDDPSTEFVDRFGVVRHDPKGRCYSRMDSALSGQLLYPRATSAEMIEPERFDLNASVSAQRCFDGSFLAEPSSRADACDYIPRNCAPMTYTHPNGCGFSIPAGDHDDVFTATNPNPQNSVGTAQAHCWDGQWEIKSSFCEQSCDANVVAREWSPAVSVGRNCTHPDNVFPERIPPSSSIDILNENAGMDGSVTYECRNGDLVELANSCLPQSCDFIPARTEGGVSASGDPIECSHQAASIASLLHGGGYVIDLANPLSAGGRFAYECQFGQMVLTSATCELQALPECVTDPTIIPPGAVDECLSAGAIYPGGICCLNNSDPACYAVPISSGVWVQTGTISSYSEWQNASTGGGVIVGEICENIGQIVKRAQVSANCEPGRDSRCPVDVFTCTQI